MRYLWQRTANLFWQRPILWLPVLGAQLLASYLKLFQRMLTHHIAFWLVSSHSVLGFNSPDSRSEDPTVYFKLTLFTAPLEQGTNYLTIWLFTAAMVVTVFMVYTISSNEKPTFVSAYVALRSYLKRISWFSLKLLVVGVVAAGASTYVFISFFFSRLSSADLSHQTSIFLFALLEVSFVVYFMTPVSLRILRDKLAVPIKPDLIRQAQIMAVLAVFAANIIARYIPMVERPFLSEPISRNSLLHHGIIVTGLLVSALPYIPLFITFAFITMDIRNQTESNDFNALTPESLPDEQALSPEETA